MARDCPDRQRGTDWRNNGYGGRGPHRAIGGGDAVDREMEVCFVLFFSPFLNDLANIIFSNSCKNFPEAHRRVMEKLPGVLKEGRVDMTRAMTTIAT